MLEACGVPELGLRRLPAEFMLSFVFIDQPAQDQSALDPLVVEVGGGVI